jgi:hypothetical protein
MTDPGAELFRCETYHCVLSKRACVEIQVLRTNQGRAAVHWCGSGRCAQGRRIRAEVGEVEQRPVKKRATARPEAKS